MYLDTEDIFRIALHCAREFHTEIRSPSALIALSSILRTPLGPIILEGSGEIDSEHNTLELSVFNTREEKIQEFSRLLKILKPLKTHNDSFGLVVIALYNRT